MASNEEIETCSSQIPEMGIGPGSDKKPNHYPLAVVLFDEKTLLPHQKKFRNFSFVGNPISIQQNWRGLGVAAVVWEAAVVLGEYLEQHRHLVEGKRVIELGSGTGLAGLVASFLGGKVTLTERAEALDFLRTTIETNLPKDNEYQIDIAELDWTKSLDNFTEHYDVILGADIIYIKETFHDLYRTLLHLTSKDTHILISCKIRYDRDSDFLNMLKKDFSLEEIFYEKERDIRIYSVYKKT
ncbi:hypothetical protein SNE40_022410 [Patella caerulea]|uniref:Uncharacterized protein n=1 Tax=Patella caerulea TaxID=87958 RepID=A0AAN8GAU2_PATCE